MLVTIVKPDFQFTNENGSLIQLVNHGWNQVNVLTSKKGSTRGGHFHKLNKEVFYIIKGKISLKLVFEDQTEINVFGSGDMFVISPFQLHEFEFVEDTVMVAMYDLGVELEDGSKDIYTNN